MRQQDVEQGAHERTLSQQMRSVRWRWIHFVFRRTVLLLMVPYGAALVLSVYFYMLSLDNVITALWITSVISWVLIIYAHLTSLDFIQSDHRTVLNSLFLAVLFYWPLCMPIHLLCYAEKDHPYTSAASILCHHLAVFSLSDELIITAQFIFGGRCRQFTLKQHGDASTLLALVITVIYLLVLFNVVVVKRGWPFFVVEIKPYYEIFV